MWNITIYTKDHCGACELVKQWMDQNDFGYNEINVSEQEWAFEVLKDMGIMQFPTVSINDFEEHWTGFDLQKMEGLL